MTPIVLPQPGDRIRCVYEYEGGTVVSTHEIGVTVEWDDTHKKTNARFDDISFEDKGIEARRISELLTAALSKLHPPSI